jgi:hypothetical protein
MQILTDPYKSLQILTNCYKILTNPYEFPQLRTGSSQAAAASLA